MGQDDLGLAVAVGVAEGDGHAVNSRVPVLAPRLQHGEAGRGVIVEDGPLVDRRGPRQADLVPAVTVHIAQGDAGGIGTRAPGVAERRQRREAGFGVIEQQHARPDDGVADDGHLVASVAVHVAESDVGGVFRRLPIVAHVDQGQEGGDGRLGLAADGGRGRQRPQQGQQQEQVTELPVHDFSPHFR